MQYATRPPHIQPNSPCSDHALETMVDIIQSSIAAAPQSQKQSIHLLMQWWLHVGNHSTLPPKQ